MLFQSMTCRPCSSSESAPSISRPTTINAGAVATPGIASTNDTNGIISRNSRPVTTTTRPERPPAATPAVDSTYAVADDELTRPPPTAPSESIRSGFSASGSSPFSSRYPAWEPTPMSVPIVSKKSVSIRLITTRIAVRMPSSVKYPNETSPISEKSGPLNGSSGILATSPGTMKATTVDAMMPQKIAALTFIAIRTIVTTNPTTATKIGHVLRCDMSIRPNGSPSGVPKNVISPAFLRPRKRMNAPIPTLMAFFRTIGTISSTYLRTPVTTSKVMIRPSVTTTPIASGNVNPMLPSSVQATTALMPNPGAIA